VIINHCDGRHRGTGRDPVFWIYPSVIPCALQHEMLLRRHGISIHRNQHHPIPAPRSNTPCCSASGMTGKHTDTKVCHPRIYSGDPDSKSCIQHYWMPDQVRHDVLNVITKKFTNSAHSREGGNPVWFRYLDSRLRGNERG